MVLKLSQAAAVKPPLVNPGGRNPPPPWAALDPLEAPPPSTAPTPAKWLADLLGHARGGAPPPRMRPTLFLWLCIANATISTDHSCVCRAGVAETCSLESQVHVPHVFRH